MTRYMSTLPVAVFTLALTACGGGGGSGFGAAGASVLGGGGNGGIGLVRSLLHFFQSHVQSR